jgi:toxin ParE1/3/4
MKLHYSATAVRDLKRLHEFIAEKNPSAAKRYSQQLLKQLQGLVLQPHQGQVLEAEQSVRELVARNYIVRYQIKENELIILKIWHGKELR